MHVLRVLRCTLRWSKKSLEKELVSSWRCYCRNSCTNMWATLGSAVNDWERLCRALSISLSLSFGSKLVWRYLIATSEYIIQFHEKQIPWRIWDNFVGFPRCSTISNFRKLTFRSLLQNSSQNSKETIVIPFQSLLFSYLELPLSVWFSISVLLSRSSSECLLNSTLKLHVTF